MSERRILQLEAEICDLEDKVKEVTEENTWLREAIGQISVGECCGTPGCSPEEPCCDVMIARAALAAEGEGEECDHQWKYQGMCKVCEKCGEHYIPPPIQPTDGGNDE